MVTEMPAEMMHIHASATHWDFWIRNTKLCCQETKLVKVFTVKIKYYLLPTRDVPQVLKFFSCNALMMAVQNKHICYNKKNKTKTKLQPKQNNDDERKR